MSKELFSITKAAGSMVQPLSWFKALMIGVKIFGILAFGFCIYSTAKAVLDPNPTTTQNQRAEQIVNNEYNFHKDEYYIDFKLWFLRIAAIKKGQNETVKRNAVEVPEKTDK